MKKSLIFCAALFACAFAFQSCDKVDNPTGEPLEPTKTVIDNGTELADAVKNFAKEGVLEVPANVVELYVSENIDLSEVEVKAENLTLSVAKGVEIKIGKPMTNVSIVGDAAEPAKIIAKEGFVANNAFGLVNVKIDASALENSKFLISTTTSTKMAKKLDGTESTECCLFGDIELDNVEITGLVAPLIKNTISHGVWNNINIQNCKIEFNGNKNVFDLARGIYENLTITNSTIYSKTGHTGYFIKIDGQASKLGYNIDNYPNNYVTTKLDHVTLYQIAKDKQMNNSNGHYKSQKYDAYVLTNSIIVYSGNADGNTVKGWAFGGESKNPKYTWGNNTYYTDTNYKEKWENSAKQAYDDSNSALDDDPAFKDIENADFTPTGAAQVEKQTGDQNWFKK